MKFNLDSSLAPLKAPLKVGLVDGQIPIKLGSRCSLTAKCLMGGQIPMKLGSRCSLTARCLVGGQIPMKLGLDTL